MPRNRRLALSLSPQEKYSQAEVVAFWTRFAISGLQTAEARMLDRYAPPPPARVIDIGCGAGRITLALAPCGYVVDGLDITAAMVRAALALAEQNGLRSAFVQADLCALPLAAGSYDLALIFIAALQHVAGRMQRRDALRQLGLALRPGGVLVLALDNIAPALRCYVEWGIARMRGTSANPRSAPSAGFADGPNLQTADALSKSGRGRGGAGRRFPADSPASSPEQVAEQQASSLLNGRVVGVKPPTAEGTSSDSPSERGGTAAVLKTGSLLPAGPLSSPTAAADSADAVLASNRTRMGRLAWHARGLSRTLRWRTWEGLRDSGRRLNIVPGEPGDTQIAQVSMPPTDGKVYYHLYAHAELVADAKMAGLRLLGYHSGTELAQGTAFGETARRLDKQVMYAFQKE